VKQEEALREKLSKTIGGSTDDRVVGEVALFRQTPS